MTIPGLSDLVAAAISVAIVCYCYAAPLLFWLFGPLLLALSTCALVGPSTTSTNRRSSADIV